MITVGTITSVLGVVAAVGKCVHWLYLTIKRIDRTNQLVEHLYVNHLPHIDQSLRLICAKLNIEYVEPTPPPPV